MGIEVGGWTEEAEEEEEEEELLFLLSMFPAVLGLAGGDTRSVKDTTPQPTGT